jgi:hypothetical protein
MGVFGSLFKPNVKAMAERGDAKGLLRCLGHNKDWRVRRAAAVGLSKVRDATALEPLIAALKDHNEEVRRSAAGALTMTLAFGLLDRRHPRDIGKARGLSDEQLRMKAVLDTVEDLGRYKDGIGLLIQGLTDDNENLRMGAAIVLGILRWQTAVPHLTEALNDSDEGVRREAALALGKIERVKAGAIDAFQVFEELFQIGFDAEYMDNAYQY